MPRPAGVPHDAAGVDGEAAVIQAPSQMRPARSGLPIGPRKFFDVPR